MRTTGASARSWWVGASWLLLAAFVVGQVVLIRAALRGPTLDEGTYITAGLRTLEGRGPSDGYLNWFAGSLLWPPIAGAGYEIAGLAGSRLAALVCVSVALAAVVKATGNLFGPRARFWATVSAVTSGPVLALAHLAVYDVLALTGVALSLWALTELSRRDNRVWLIVAAVSMVLAVLAKYPTLFFSLPPLMAVIWATRGRRARMDLAIFAFASFALLSTYYLLDREELSRFLVFRVEQNPNFGVTRAMIVYGQAYFLGLGLVLAAAAWVVARGRRRLAAALLLGMLTPPVLHLMSGNSVGDHKHAVFGLVFGLPLAGLTLASAWDGWGRRVLMVPAVAGLAVFGGLQMVRIDQSWPEVRPTAAYLKSQVRPGDRLLINNSWPFTQYLYADKRINSPWDVYDVYRVQERQNPVSLCDFDWFVDAAGGAPWPTSVQTAIHSCGTFRQVYQSRSEITGLTCELQFVTYNDANTRLRVYRNMHRPVPEPAPSLGRIEQAAASTTKACNRADES